LVFKGDFFMAVRTRTVGLRKLNVTVTAPGTPVPCSLTPLFVTDFEVHVKSGNLGANVYIGDETVDNTWIPRAKGTNWNFVHGTGNFIGRDPVLSFDLSKIFVDADGANDSIIVQYYGVDRGVRDA
jgi:hypothetical protein